MSTPGDTPPSPPQLATAPASSKGGAGHWALLITILALVCAMMRLSGLMALPIFGDEAIYLRWSQLIRGEGLSGPTGAGELHPWISLADPKPPLHFWLIALFYRWSPNPLVVARHISVIAGILSVPLLYAACRELGELLRIRSKSDGSGGTKEALPIFATGRVWGLLAALLLIFCPFFSFYQRLATADALFAAQSIAIVWLSLRWARQATHPWTVRPGAPWVTAILLGIAIGAALMTRQGLSYTMSLMPGVAWLLHRFSRTSLPPATDPAKPPSTRRSDVFSFFQLATAALLAAAIWSPYLVAELAPRALEFKREALSDRNATLGPGDLTKEVRRRILYQEKFTDRQDPGAIVSRNFRLTFIPGVDGRGVTNFGWFYYYLTPVVYFACLAGLVYLGIRRQWLALILLVAWIVLAMGPVVLLANVIFSRYVLAGVPPFLVAAAFLMGELLGILFTKLERRPALQWIGVLTLFFAMLVPPLFEIGRQASKWRQQTLTGADNYQYISGWTAGQATERAAVALLRLSQQGPIFVITDNGWGTPADALWVYLSDRPNIQLYYTDRPTILDPVDRQQGTAGEVWLRPNKFLYPPYEKVMIPPDVPILYVTREHAGPVIDHLRKENPTITLFETFAGVTDPKTGKGDPEGAVSIFQLPRPAHPPRPSGPAR